MEKSVMTAKEVASDYFEGSVSYWKVLEEFRCGRMPGFKIGPRIFFRRESLDKWVMQEEAKHIEIPVPRQPQYGSLRVIAQ